MNHINNGRIDIIQPNTCALFQLYDKIPNKPCSSYLNPTEGLWDDTVLSKLYFSSENIQIIQNAIRRGVYEKSNKQYVISEQSCDDLKTIMRSIFLQYSKNNPCQIQQQIISLNKMVIDYCVDKIYSEALGYMHYIKDASTLVIPLDYPTYSSVSGKTIEFKRWF